MITSEAAIVRRSLGDTNKILKAALRSTTRVSGRLRARLIAELLNGHRFEIKPYIMEQLLPILEAVMQAGHFAGYNRSWLVAPKKNLSLSALDDALAILKKRAGIDINQLQQKYSTDALKVLSNASDGIENELRGTMEELVLEGAHKAEAVRRLGEKFDALGLSPRADYQLEAIFRTQLQLTFSAGKYQAERDPDIDEILWGYKYVTVGDDRVRDSHAPLDGTTLPKDDPFWQRFYPPNGWNCRCQLIPIYETREVVRPSDTVEPDKGFNFNPGVVFQ